MNENETGYSHRFSVAPMLDWTDRHCRYFHRLLTGKALLYTEMVVTDAAINGDPRRILDFDPAEHPVALQLGGSDPAKLAQAAKICAAHGYDEINLNVGCPSDRVQSGAFGACLMLSPGLVADCVKAMKDAVSVPVTVKCRIGVDDQDPESALFALASAVRQAGADALWVHARKAWLKGLSPKENREIPPLDYPLVHRLTHEHADWFVGINGGIATLDLAREQLAHVDGVMLGRAAYQNPGILAGVDALIDGRTADEPDWHGILEAMAAYSVANMARGERFCHVSRHMVGLFHGMPGARRWRQILSTAAVRDDAGPDLLFEAFSHVRIGAEAA